MFESYDIRGIYEKEITLEKTYFLGLGFGNYINNNTSNNIVCVGRDGRLSSPALSEKLINGLIDSGLNVINLGLVTSPILYFADLYFKAAGSIMITASHNPKEYNGFKIMYDNKPFYGEKLQYLKEQKVCSVAGSVKKIDLIDCYINKLFAGFKFNKEHKIAWDCGNGAVGAIIEKFVRKIPGKHFIINQEVDGNFPSYKKDKYHFRSLDQLSELVIKNNCDLGFCFDGDGDRFNIIGKNGEFVCLEKIIYYLASNIIKNNNEAKIVLDMKIGDFLAKELEKKGAKVFFCKTGHSYIKDKVKSLKASFAGELSGHLFFPDRYYNFDDALYASLRVIEFIEDNKFENYILPDFYSTNEIRIECDPKKIKRLINYFMKYVNSQNHYFSKSDGIRYSEGDSFWVIRESNTEKCISIRVQSKSYNNFEFWKKKISKIAQYNDITILW